MTEPARGDSGIGIRLILALMISRCQSGLRAPGGAACAFLERCPGLALGTAFRGGVEVADKWEIREDHEFRTEALAQRRFWVTAYSGSSLVRRGSSTAGTSRAGNERDRCASCGQGKGLRGILCRADGRLTYENVRCLACVCALHSHVDDSGIGRAAGRSCAFVFLPSIRTRAYR